MPDIKTDPAKVAVQFLTNCLVQQGHSKDVLDRNLTAHGVCPTCIQFTDKCVCTNELTKDKDNEDEHDGEDESDPESSGSSEQDTHSPIT